MKVPLLLRIFFYLFFKLFDNNVTGFKSTLFWFITQSFIQNSLFKLIFLKNVLILRKELCAWVVEKKVILQKIRFQ